MRNTKLARSGKSKNGVGSNGKNKVDDKREIGNNGFDSNELSENEITKKKNC